MSLFKSLKKVLKVAAPLALSYFAPGLGTALGTGLGLAEGAGASTIGNALLGGGIGALTGGGLKGAGIGALTGGIGANLGGIADSIGSSTGLNSLIGNSGWTNPDTGLLASGSGSGVLGTVGKGLASVGLNPTTGLAGSGTGGGGSSYGSAATALGGIFNASSIDSAEKAQQDANKRAMALINPYVQTGTSANSKLSELLGVGGDASSGDYGSLTKQFSPTDLANDPGYQFQLQQGQQALDRNQSARGNYFSGGALKAAQDYGQNLAQTTYGNAFNRDMQSKQSLYSQLAGLGGQGLSAAGAGAGLASTSGDITANANMAQGNNLSSTLASIANPNSISLSDLLKKRISI